MRRPWMLDHLAAATRAHHGSADADRLAILDLPSRERYRMFLARIYCFEAPFEAALVATDRLPCDLLHAHVKTHALADDLAGLGVDARYVAPARTLRFDSHADALAWMWVVHRNTLLHGQLRRELARKLPETASAYLAIHEGCAGAVMRELGTALDAAARRASIADRIVAAATEAFHAQRLWFSCELTLAPRKAA